MDRRKILRRVDHLIDNHCKICPIFGTQKASQHQCTVVCEVGLELIDLGKRMESNSKEQLFIKSTLDKGRDMTTKEIKQLYDMGVPKHRITRSLKMGRNKCYEMIQEIVKNLDRTG